VDLFQKAVAFAACLSILAPGTASMAAARPYAKGKAHYRYYARKGGDCPLRRVAGGDLADCHGWRLIDGRWDNTCFNLDYLPSQYACSGPGTAR
jgi:hypothetical protein